MVFDERYAEMLDKVCKLLEVYPNSMTLDGTVLAPSHVLELWPDIADAFDDAAFAELYDIILADDLLWDDADEQFVHNLVVNAMLSDFDGISARSDNPVWQRYLEVIANLDTNEDRFGSVMYPMPDSWRVLRDRRMMAYKVITTDLLAGWRVMTDGRIASPLSAFEYHNSTGKFDDMSEEEYAEMRGSIMSRSELFLGTGRYAYLDELVDNMLRLGLA